MKIDLLSFFICLLRELGKVFEKLLRIHIKYKKLKQRALIITETKGFLRETDYKSNEALVEASKICKKLSLF